MKNGNDKVHWECGNGWAVLINPIIERTRLNGATILQIKEKFGRLRVYFDPPDADDGFEDMVDQAEEDSSKMCEMCGKPGRTLVKGGWLKTLCADDALSLGYNERA